jgi:cytoskeletal protein RodZ
MNFPRISLISACFAVILTGLSSCENATPTAETPEAQTSSAPAKPAAKPSAKPAAMAEKSTAPLAKASAPAEKKEPAPLAQKEAVKPSPAPSAKAAAAGPETISFAKGATSAIAKGSVVRGDRKIYLVNAAKNQAMTLSVTALESNAVVDLVAPDGKILKQEATTVKQVLPATGDYQVIVSGTRGNATYEVTIAIE